MRIWDLNPGYLNRQSLLGEHRELHGIVSILVNEKKGYANHPETLRWSNHRWALTQRHQLLAAEMELRGYTERSPVNLPENPEVWPETFLDSPMQQIHILKQKYLSKEPGRIPLPVSAQQIWAHHKYSVLARNPEQYKALGREVAKRSPDAEYQDIALELVTTLRMRPTPGGFRNALQHMWGYVSKSANQHGERINSWDNHRLLVETQKAAFRLQQPYLISSTALSELKIWI